MDYNKLGKELHKDGLDWEKEKGKNEKRFSMAYYLDWVASTLPIL